MERRTRAREELRASKVQSDLALVSEMQQQELKAKMLSQQRRKVSLEEKIEQSRQRRRLKLKLDRLRISQVKQDQPLFVRMEREFL